MNAESKTELNRIMSCLLIAVEESGIVMGVGDCTRLASHFQDALKADGMALMWQFAIDKAAAELEAGL